MIMIEKKFEEFVLNLKKEEIKNKFLFLKKEWLNNYSFLPNEEKYTNDCYKSIINIGNDVVPLLIEDMFSDTGISWYEALTQITGVWPIPKDNYNRKTYKTYWKKWFEENYV